MDSVLLLISVLVFSWHIGLPVTEPGPWCSRSCTKARVAAQIEEFFSFFWQKKSVHLTYFFMHLKSFEQQHGMGWSCGPSTAPKHTGLCYERGKDVDHTVLCSLLPGTMLLPRAKYCTLHPLKSAVGQDGLCVFLGCRNAQNVCLWKEKGLERKETLEIIVSRPLV